MKTMSARDARHQFGRPIYTARSEPLASEKQGDQALLTLVIK